MKRQKPYSSSDLRLQSRVCLNRYAFKTYIYPVVYYHSENFQIKRSIQKLKDNMEDQSPYQIHDSLVYPYVEKCLWDALSAHLQSQMYRDGHVVLLRWGYNWQACLKWWIWQTDWLWLGNSIKILLHFLLPFLCTTWNALNCQTTV